MPAVVTPISRGKIAVWSLLEVARPGCAALPFGILLVTDNEVPPVVRMRDVACFEELEEDEFDVLVSLEDDLLAKGRELGGEGLLAWLEDGLSHFMRVSERTRVVYTRTAGGMADRLFEEFVDSRIQKYVTHLPRYSVRAAATRFGELMEAEEEEWVRVRARQRLTDGMFVAQVVGQSMEPRIPDGSYCIFRAPVVGSRNGRLLLIEQLGEDDVAARYTVKRYARVGMLDEGEERTASVRLEPLNPRFEAFALDSDRFRVIAEFVQVVDL